jgi:hypothetical protein
MRNLRWRATAGLLGVGIVSLNAAPVTGTAVITADNHYGLYTGLADGSDLIFVGRNEFGSGGNPGSYNWSEPETWSVSLDLGRHLYVVAWDDGGPQSWIGQFTFDGNTLFSDAAHWEYLVGSGANPGENGGLPATGDLTADISGGAWNPVTLATANGAAPWGTIHGIDGAANFVWSDTFDANSADDSHYVIFRTSSPVIAGVGFAAAVPETGTMAAGIALAGIAGLAVWRHRRNASR